METNGITGIILVVSWVIITVVYWGYMGIMEKKMETTMKGYRGFRVQGIFSFDPQGFWLYASGDAYRCLKICKCLERKASKGQPRIRNLDWF